MSLNEAFWRGKRVFVTGHTGFKGGWLSLWLQNLGCTVMGFSLEPPSVPSFFEVAQVQEGMSTVHGDICDAVALTNALVEFQPDVVFHLAAQSLVRRSYEIPAETYATNVVGTAILLDAVRKCESVRSVVVVTTDKCYDNQEWVWGYREQDRLGGADPYSSSKACAELVVEAMRRSFFSSSDDNAAHRVGIASVRSGNVIGGGDWSVDRIIPDVIRSILSNSTITLRYPLAIRPWSFVLDPLRGYLMLAEQLYHQPERFASAWNFGPIDAQEVTVQTLVSEALGLWDNPVKCAMQSGDHVHEAHYLRLDCSKSRRELSWQPFCDFETMMRLTMEWYKTHHTGKTDMRDYSLRHIERYQTPPNPV